MALHFSILTMTYMKAPSIAQQTMSGERCLLLGGTLPTYETFVAQWQVMATSPNHPQLALFIQEGLSWATSYHKRMRANKAYLFAMCRSSITLQCLANFTLSNLKSCWPFHPVLMGADTLECWIFVGERTHLSKGRSLDSFEHVSWL